MAETMRVIDVYFDVTESRLRISDEDSGQPNTVITHRRFENCLLRFHCFNSAGDAYEIETGTTFLFGIDTVYESGHADPVLSENSLFLPTDWSGAGGWSLADGRICCRADFNTEDLADILAEESSGHITGHAVLWAFPPAGKPYPLAVYDVDLWDVAVEPEEPADTPEAPTARRGRVEVTEAVEQVAVTHENFGGSDNVITLGMAASSAAITSMVSAWVLDDTITATGFTLQLSAPAPAGIRIHWRADRPT